MINLKGWWMVHKYQVLFLIAVLAMTIITGCTTGQGSTPPPPSGPIGGGCG